MITGPVQSAALFVSAANAEAITGMNWRRCCALAEEHGVPVYQLGPRSRLIDAQALLAAIPDTRTRKFARNSQRDRLSSIVTTQTDTPTTD